MKRPWIIAAFSLGVTMACEQPRTRGDAIVVSKAMSATTIAEVFVDERSIRVVLEIGAADLPAFKRLMPDEIYAQLGGPDVDYPARLKHFFLHDFVIREEELEQPISGKLVQLAARKRIVRDEMTGEPLAAQPDAAQPVVYAELQFPLRGFPGRITLKPPTSEDHRAAANIGFVTYHRGLAVTEFRYLSKAETLDLNWRDPWYSRYRNPNLHRQYDSPASAFLYIEPFEVRKEIVIRPVDLQRWVDLGIDVQATIPVAAQAELKRRVAEFLRDKHPVTIDGHPAKGELDRIHFIRRTLRKTGVVYPDEELPAVSATLGVIFVYPIERLPEQVTMTWELFDDRIQSIPASATDEAGGLPSTLTADDPQLVWQNFLTNPTIPAMRSIPPPTGPTRLALPVLSIILLLSAFLLLVQWNRSSPKNAGSLVLPLILLVAAFASFPLLRVAIPNPLSRDESISEAQAVEIMDSLLHNVYHAFDRCQESLVYDQLATSLSGDILTDVYLQTRRRIELADQGGAQIKIDEIRLLSNELKTVEYGNLNCRSRWSVAGTVGHWGHLHRRELGFEADFDIEPIEGVWKITSMQILNETTGPVEVNQP